MLQEQHPLIGRKIAIRKAIPLVIRAAPDMARFSLRIDAAALAKASTTFGLQLPSTIGEIAASGGRQAICLGPDEWYLIAPLTDQNAVETAFTELSAKTAHSLVDVGHREVAIEIEGVSAALALRSAVSFDVEAMPVKRGCRTLFDRTQIILMREAEDRFRIEVWRSFADHVWSLLAAASREIDLDI